MSLNNLQGMLPGDLFHYCQEHRLLESVTDQPASTHARMPTHPAAYAKEL